LSARNHFVGELHPCAPEADGAAASRKLKILHVLFSSRMAGSERYCVDLANGQAALGHEVHVAGRYGSPMAQLLSDKVVFHGFAMPFMRGLRVRWLAERAGIEVAHGHLSHGCKALSSTPDHVARIATLHVGYKARQHAEMDGVICVNSAQAGRLGAYGGQSMLISNWLPDVAADEDLDIRAQLNLPRETRLVGSVGRLHPSKGYDVLVRAFRQLAPENAALVIVGDGPQRQELETLAQGDSRIHLPGHCNNVAGFLRNLDFFVSPSREESAGLAILEAMHEGLPIIATAAEGPSEYLREHPVTLVEPGSVEQLSKALSDILREESVVRLSRVSYDLAPFSRSTGIAHVLDFYSRVIHGAAAQVEPDADQPRLIYASETQE
jgi:glycosyltransferase involved in cell wall biosynthesis